MIFFVCQCLIYVWIECGIVECECDFGGVGYLMCIQCEFVGDVYYCCCFGCCCDGVECDWWSWM